MKNPTAQELTITLLRKIKDPYRRMAIWKDARRDLDGDTPAGRQLDLCVMMAGERKKRDNVPFSELAKSIVSRQTNKSIDKITKLDIYRSIKNGEIREKSANNTVDSIDCGVRELRAEEIEVLCSGFEDESNRLFWKNQLHIHFPNLPAEDAQDGPVIDCLQATWNNLTKEEQEFYRATLYQYADCFEALDGKAPKRDEHQEAEPHLYKTLEGAMKKCRMSQEAVAEALGMDKDTYGNYKRAWNKFENNSCEGGFPRNRLSRERLLYLAVLLDMSFETTVCMLAMAGYSFHGSEADRNAAGYLLGREYTKEEALKRLHPKAKR